MRRSQGRWIRRRSYEGINDIRATVAAHEGLRRSFGSARHQAPSLTSTSIFHYVSIGEIPDLAKISWRMLLIRRDRQDDPSCGGREATESPILSAATERSQELEELFQKVRRGELMPDAAEAEAERLGFGKLANTPDPSGFDPMKQAWWALPMVIAWIACRSPEIVREYWDRYRSVCVEWHFCEWRERADGPVRGGHFLAPRRPATISSLYLAEKRNWENGSSAAEMTSIDDAKAQLWAALSQNEVQAAGIDTATNLRTPIPDHAWLDLATIEERGRDVLRFREPRGGLSSRGYDDVVFRRRNILAMWRPRRPEVCEGDVSSQIRPDKGRGYMPLYCAAHWIATKGCTLQIDPLDLGVWESPFSQLLSRISSGEVAVTGLRKGEREKIEGHIFAGISVEYPSADPDFGLLLSSELYLSSCIYVDDEHWRQGFNDSLQTRHGAKWSHLMALKSDVLRHWPFSSREHENHTAPSVTKTGAPGRPSSMHLVEREYLARAARGDTNASIGEEAKVLCDWLQSAHPDAPPLTAKTIANRMRHEHRERMRKAQK